MNHFILFLAGANINSRFQGSRIHAHFIQCLYLVHHNGLHMLGAQLLFIQ